MGEIEAALLLTICILLPMPCCAEPSHSQGGVPGTTSQGGKRRRTSRGSDKRAAQPLEAMRPLVLLSSMHSSEQAKCTKALAKLGIQCLSHADCER